MSDANLVLFLFWGYIVSDDYDDCKVAVLLPLKVK